MKEQHHHPQGTKSFNLNYRKPGWRLAARWGSLLATLALALAVAPRAGATITVTALNDSGSGSLRQAIADAAPGDTIDFAVTGTITLTNGELGVYKDLTIAGPGTTNLTVSGNNVSRVFSFTSVTGAVSGLTIANGRTLHSNGAGVDNTGGSLTISNCVVASNVNVSPSDPGSYYDAAIFNFQGTLRLINSTVSGNTSGGLLNDIGFCMITNTTISGNTGWVQMWNYIGTVWLCSSTVASDRTTDYSIGATANSTLHLFNSILAGKLYVNRIGSSAISHDFNLIQNTNEAAITGVTTHNIYGKDPLLGPLAENGGPTLTHALLPGSPAIDHGSSGGLTTDQRGQPRIFNFPAYIDADDGSDIGAYELQERAQTGPVFTVNSNDDVDDGVPGIAHCSLREAVKASNSTPGTNTINFASTVLGLMTGVTGTITLTNGELAATNSVNINGPGAANLTVSGNNASRVFSFNNVTAAISGLTIARGRNLSESSPGGGLYNYLGALTMCKCTVTGNLGLNGGGIYNNSGTVALIQSTVSANSCWNSTWSNGGGINNLGGVLHIISSAIVSNGNCGDGGGIWNNASLRLTNSTVSGNGSAWTGGGITDQGSTIIFNSTICSNGTGSTGGGIDVMNGYGVHVGSSIIAGNTLFRSDSVGPDFAGPLNSLDFVLIQNTNGCSISGTTTHNLYNQDPKLGPLADLGGPTPTHALRFDSPAIDAANSGGLTTDQRGMPRTIDDPNIANAEGGDGSDIGAYEADPNLRINGIGKTGGDIWLSFNTVWGRTYRVETTDAFPPTWNVLTNGVVGTGGRFQALDGGAASLPKRFYRTVLLLP